MGGIFLIVALLPAAALGDERRARRQGPVRAAGRGRADPTIFFYVAINLMMVMGLAPVVGIPLPLVSYGGSAMMTVMICLGILMSIERQNRRERRR